MNTQFNTNVYNFSQEIVKSLLETFDGKVVGSEDMNLELVMKSFFDDYQPGDQVEEDPVKDDKVKKKVKKKDKDPNEPKRPTTAFFFFTADIRQEVKEANPDLKVSDLAKIHGEKWRNLSDEGRQKYLEMNVADKERYNKEMEVWGAKKDAK